MVKSSKKALAVLLAVACLITFMPAMASQSFAAKKLTVKPAKKTIYVKKSFTLKANQKVKWFASKSSLKVVRLTSKKAKSVKVTGKKVGKAVVTVKAGKQTKKVTITVKKAKAAVNSATVKVEIQVDGKTAPPEVILGKTLTAVVTPSTANVTFQWKKGGVAIPGATSATYKPEVKGTYTVEAKLANNEMVFDSVSITDLTINRAFMWDVKKDNNRGTRDFAVVGDELELAVYAKDAYGRDVHLWASDGYYRTEMYINGAKAYPAYTDFTTNPNAAPIAAGEDEDGVDVPEAYRLKGDTVDRPVKLNDTISFKVIGTGIYDGVELDSNTLSVTKLGTLKDVPAGVTAEQVTGKAIIRIAGLTEDNGLTATIFKVEGTFHYPDAAYTKIGAVTYKDAQETGDVDFVLDSAVSKNGDTYAVWVSKADYDGSVEFHDPIVLSHLGEE